LKHQQTRDRNDNPLLTPHQALSDLLRSISKPVVQTERIPLNKAKGRVSATQVLSPIDLPPFTSSAMDGFAVNLGDPVFQQPPPWQLPIQGTSLAGSPFDQPLEANAAVRIFTGAVVPHRADTVVIQEDTQIEERSVRIEGLPIAGSNIRGPGHDIGAGQVLLEAGKTLDAFDIGWLAASGIDEVRVFEKLRLSIFSTGDELVDPGEPLGDGQIYESNRIMLSELMGELPVQLQDMGILPDDLQKISDALKTSAETSHVVLTSGGVSVGDADFVRVALEQMGSLSFWKLAIKPGKPLAYGEIGDSLFFGLPGNPVSSVVTFLILVVPVLRKLSGCSPQPVLEVTATLGDDIAHSQGRVEYQRGVYHTVDGNLEVATTGNQGSNRIGSLAGCNCLIKIPPERGALAAGDSVCILPLKGLLP